MTDQLQSPTEARRKEIFTTMGQIIRKHQFDIFLLLQEPETTRSSGIAGVLLGSLQNDASESAIHLAMIVLLRISRIYHASHLGNVKKLMTSSTHVACDGRMADHALDIACINIVSCQSLAVAEFIQELMRHHS